jgi:hypothetical protein
MENKTGILFITYNSLFGTKDGVAYIESKCVTIFGEDAEGENDDSI